MSELQDILKVIKRNGDLVDFDINKIKKAINSAFISSKCNLSPIAFELLIKEIINGLPNPIGVEEIQNRVEFALMKYGFYSTAKSFILYREKHKDIRLLQERIDYMNKYSSTETNAASASETDANSNVSQKNVANLEGEVYKTTNRLIQRRRMKQKLMEMFPEVANSYEEDLNNHIIYVHDEATTPTLKLYCMAASLYPLLLEGTGKIDGVTPSEPNDLQSFSGQISNLLFLLASQVKGAVAFGEFFIALNYYAIKEFGDNWQYYISAKTTSPICKKTRTIKDQINKAMKQFIYFVNQPMGNRSFNSPFSNVNIFDKEYFNSLFNNFYYPNGTQPKWDAIDVLQRMFLQLHRELRAIKPLTFPVSTICLIHNGKEFVDKEYQKLCSEEWSKGSSHFVFINDNPSSIASCCRVLNEIADNTFSSTTGLTGVMTGSCNVITLNINRILQDFFIDFIPSDTIGDINSRIKNSIDYYKNNREEFNKSFSEYLISILERVYKYQIAYKTMLYEQEEKGMYAGSNGGYIYIRKLYSTIGIIGYFEAARFLNIDTTYNKDYIEFLQLILGTIKEQNRLHSIVDSKRPFIFNSEAVPGEGLGVKLYNWDKEDGYIVPKDQNLYNCYFYNPWNDTDILTKMKLHGKEIASYCDGGQACHLNLYEHPSIEQCNKLLEDAILFGTNYFTLNIPMSECEDCHHTVNAPVTECPKCHSKNISYWTRIIGYLTKVNNWSSDRIKEFHKRNYGGHTL